MIRRTFKPRRNLLAYPEIIIEDRFEKCDAIEVKVVITPLNELKQCGDPVYAQMEMVTLEGADGRYWAHVVRQMIANLAARWLGVEF